MSKLNPNASSFTFNPKASSFRPGGAAAGPPPGLSGAAPRPEGKLVVLSKKKDAGTWEDMARTPAPSAASPAPAPAPAPSPAPASVAAPSPSPAPVTTSATTSPAPSSSPAPAPTTSPAPAAKVVSLAPPGGPTLPKEEKKEEKKETKKVEKQDEKSESKMDSTPSDRKAKFVPNKDQATYKPHDEREHLNIVFIGHVDAGKSTISGQILLLTGQVDERTIQKYEKEAKEKGRDSWYIAFIMDTNEEERAKGKTVEVGRAHFATTNKRYTLLDAPGHKNYVPNMIGGASQADVGVLVISARKGEFETGFDRGGQTREHAMLAKTLGISRLIILVNKMDEQTVQWSKARYDEIETKLTPFLKKWGYKESDISYVPCSGYTGANLRDPVTPQVCPWWKGQSLLQVLDSMPRLDRDAGAPVRIPIMARYKDMGFVHILGKLEAGTLYKGQRLLMQPNSVEIDVLGIQIDEVDVNMAKPGENLCLKIKGIEEEDIHPGFVLSPADQPAKRTREFEAQIAVLDLLEHKPLITKSYFCILHIHSLSVECQITKLTMEVDQKTGKPSAKKPKFFRSGAQGTVVITTEETIVVEMFKDYPQLGRFTLRDEGRTIAIGKVMAVRQAAKTSDQSK